MKRASLRRSLQSKLCLKKDDWNSLNDNFGHLRIKSKTDIFFLAFLNLISAALSIFSYREQCSIRSECLNRKTSLSQLCGILAKLFCSLSTNAENKAISVIRSYTQFNILVDVVFCLQHRHNSESILIQMSIEKSADNISDYLQNHLSFFFI